MDANNDPAKAGGSRLAVGRRRHQWRMGRIPQDEEYAGHYKSWGRIWQSADLLAANMALTCLLGDSLAERLIEGEKVPFQRLIFDYGNMDSAASVRREMYLPTGPLWPSDSLASGPITSERQV